jgi:hypothetical protein
MIMLSVIMLVMTGSSDVEHVKEEEEEHGGDDHDSDDRDNDGQSRKRSSPYGPGADLLDLMRRLEDGRKDLVPRVAGHRVR